MGRNKLGQQSSGEWLEELLTAGLGSVGGEGHKQAGLRLGHEEETGGGRSRP